MNKIFLTAGALLTFFSLTAANFAPKGWETELAAAQEKAAESKKPILVLISGPDWCGPCEKLHKEVISNKKFNSIALKYAVGLFLYTPGGAKKNDPQTVKDIKTCQKFFKRGGVPRYMLVDADLKPLGTPQKRTIGDFLLAISDASVKMGGKAIPEVKKFADAKDKEKEKDKDKDKEKASKSEAVSS
jgi:thiol-disulfide isomerase/thioredoxin